MGIEEKVDMLRWELAVVVVMLLILMYSAAVTGSLYLPGFTHNTTASGNMLIEGMNLKSPQKRGGLGHADKKGSHKSLAKKAPMFKRNAQKSGFAAYTINGADPFSDGIDTIGGTFVNTSMLF